MEATYCKLNDGSWGMRVAGRAFSGSRVMMRKKSGACHAATVGKIISRNSHFTIATILHSDAIAKASATVKAAATVASPVTVGGDDRDDGFTDYERQQEERAYKAEMARDEALEEERVQREKAERDMKCADAKRKGVQCPRCWNHFTASQMLPCPTRPDSVKMCKSCVMEVVSEDLDKAFHG